MKVTVNSYYTDTDYETLVFRSDLNFLFYIMFGYATNRERKKIVFVEGDEGSLEKYYRICDYLSILRETRNEPTVQETKLIQKIGDIKFYENLLSKIYNEN